MDVIWVKAKERLCAKALECLRLTKGEAVCPEKWYCHLYDELGDGEPEDEYSA
jgi:hypothetical protein